MNNKKGFTLVELIVTMVLVSIMMIFLFNLLSDIKNEESKSNYNATYQTSASILNEYIQNILLKNKITGISTCTIDDYCSKTTFENGNYMNIRISNNTRVITIEIKSSSNVTLSYERRQLPEKKDGTYAGSICKFSVKTTSSTSSYLNKYLTTYRLVLKDTNNNTYPIEAYYVSDTLIEANNSLINNCN